MSEPLTPRNYEALYNELVETTASRIQQGEESRSPHRIFISGPLTPRGKREDCDHPAIEYIMNCRDMINASNELMRMGWATYCPALDFLNFLLAGLDLPVDKIFAIDLAWVDVSDAILMVGNWEKSKGAVGEHMRAIKLGLSVYYSIKDVPNYAL